MAVRVTRLHLVRHGRAAAGWDSDQDPGLDEVGRQQAAHVASLLVSLASSGSLPILTSPLRRCQETAAPLARLWSTEVIVSAEVAEIPSPHGVEMADRVEWLRAAMRGTWAELGERYTAFRDGIVDALVALPGDSVVFSHFVAINAVIGAATDDERLVIRSFDNCSVTVVDVIDGTLRLVEGGHEADTLVR